MSYTKKVNRNCSNCGNSIATTNTNDVIFCSKECMDAYSLKTNVTLNETNGEQNNVKPKCKCEVCENDFECNVLRQVSIKNKNKLICGNCYKGLIHFSNNVDYLQNAIKFLKE